MFVSCLIIYQPNWLNFSQLISILPKELSLFNILGNNLFQSFQKDSKAFLRISPTNIHKRAKALSKVGDLCLWGVPAIHVHRCRDWPRAAPNANSKDNRPRNPAKGLYIKLQQEPNF